MANEPNAPVKAESGQGRLSRWDPFETLQQEMARFWGQGWPFSSLLASRLGQAGDTWMPRMDVFEQDGNFVVKAELPGVDRENINVTLEQGDLIIRGERKAESEVKEENYYRMERSYGSFQRRLPLPFEAKADDVKATYKDGVLEVTVPKPAETKPAPQKISVS